MCDLDFDIGCEDVEGSGFGSIRAGFFLGSCRHKVAG